MVLVSYSYCISALPILKQLCTPDKCLLF